MLQAGLALCFCAADVRARAERTQPVTQSVRPRFRGGSSRKEREEEGGGRWCNFRSGINARRLYLFPRQHVLDPRQRPASHPPITRRPVRSEEAGQPWRRVFAWRLRQEGREGGQPTLKGRGPQAPCPLSVSGGTGGFCTCLRSRRLRSRSLLRRSAPLRCRRQGNIRAIWLRCDTVHHTL